jgi:hypothetical protein
VGGPIRKGKTFFFVDFEKVRQHDPVNLSGTVPTDAERNGDFSNTYTADPNTGERVLQQVYNPLQCTPLGPNPSDGCQRTAIPGNRVDLLNSTQPGLIDPIGQALL